MGGDPLASSTMLYQGIGALLDIGFHDSIHLLAALFGHGEDRLEHIDMQAMLKVDQGDAITARNEGHCEHGAVTTFLQIIQI